MRIATWNMDYWRRTPAARTAAWTFLTACVRPDIALLQEAVPPPACSDRIVWRPGGILDTRATPARDLTWGSAVVSFGPDVRAVTQAQSPFRKAPVDLLRTLPGSVAIAEVERSDSSPLVVVSAYGVIDGGHADTTVHRILSDLTPLIEERRARRMVIAGDLNVTTQWSAKHKAFLRGRQREFFRRDSNLFERFAALGFHNVVTRGDDMPLPGCDCPLGAACRHVQTQRHERSAFPWQNDYVFVTEDLLGLKPQCEVFDSKEAWQLSGHCPIVVTIPVETL